MLFKRPSGVNWILVFLGNPGQKYAGSRHNVGFMTAQALEKRLGVRIDRLRFKALTAQATLGGEKVFLMDGGPGSLYAETAASTARAS